MTATEHTVLPGKSPDHQLADELNELLTRWAKSGLVTPMVVADFLMDAQAQTMAFSVTPGRMEESLQAAHQLLRSKVYGHVQRLAHMRGPQAPPPEPGKAN